MLRRVGLPLLALLLSAGLLWFFLDNSLLANGANPSALASGFTDELVTSLPLPTALAFTPDDRLLITTQGGNLRVYQLSTNTLVSTPALSLGTKVCTNSERGLLGVAIDPAFDGVNNQYIYLYYTFNRFNDTPSNCNFYPGNYPVNRVSRFTLAANNTIDPASELVLIDNIPSPGGNHNAGDLHFGQDGYLYISAGDGGASITDGLTGGGNTNARRLDILSGKILRIKKDGTLPSDNPYVNMAGNRRCGDPAGVPGGTGPCNETFAWGLRNPFRFTFKPNTNNFYINDVGQDTWEEIDLGQNNADYGWNVREGHCTNGSTSNCGTPPAGMTNPLYDYPHPTSGCGPVAVGGSITGGAFVPVGVWPSTYDGSYLFADYVCDKIFQLKPDNTFDTASNPFATPDGANPGSIDSPVNLLFGPYNSTQALYYTNYYGGGQVRRIFYKCDGAGASNCSPTASLIASPTAGVVPLQVTLDGHNSTDPNPGDTLSYIWDYGDGSPVVTTTTSIVTHTYTIQGNFTASLKVRDNNGAFSVPVTAKINAGNNTPPVPKILSPATGTLFKVGEVLTLSGSATDKEDGGTCCALSWQIIKHHASHIHPFYGPVSGNNLSTPAMPEPEDLLAATNSYLEIQLTAMDSVGASTTITQALNPHMVNLTFNTVPAGLTIIANSTTTLTGPQTVVEWDSAHLLVNAPSPQNAFNNTWTFSNWSDSGAASHIITVPSSNTSYTATFTSPNCYDLLVTIGSPDDGNQCGTLRNAINQATNGDTITIAPSASPISLTDTLVINKAIRIIGACSPNSGPQITLDGTAAGPGKIGLDLRGGVSLFGLKVIGFRGNPGTTNSPHIKLVRNISSPSANRLQCVKVSR